MSNVGRIGRVGAEVYDQGGTSSPQSTRRIRSADPVGSGNRTDESGSQHSVRVADRTARDELSALIASVSPRRTWDNRTLQNALTDVNALHGQGSPGALALRAFIEQDRSLDHAVRVHGGGRFGG